jgi:hypothetical protein
LRFEKDWESGRGDGTQVVTALYFLIVSFAGLFLGPMTVGLLNDNSMGEEGVRYSVALVPIIYSVPVLFLMRLALRGYREKLRGSLS